MNKGITVAMIATIALAACGQARGQEGGATVSRNYPVGSFEQIEVSGPYEVEVRTGSAPSVSASGPDRMMERLVVEVKDGRLLIHSREERGTFSFGSKRGKVRLNVTVPQLRAADLAGSGDIRIDRINGEQFAGNIAGSGELRLDEVTVRQLSFDIAGSGGISARSGRAENMAMSIAGSGDIEAAGVVGQTAKVSIAGSGGVTAQARGTASVDIMGSGNVELTGGAKCTVSKMGSGDVRCS